MGLLMCVTRWLRLKTSNFTCAIDKSASHSTQHELISHKKVSNTGQRKKIFPLPLATILSLILRHKTMQRFDISYCLVTELTTFKFEDDHDVRSGTKGPHISVIFCKSLKLFTLMWLYKLEYFILHISSMLSMQKFVLCLLGKPCYD